MKNVDDLEIRKFEALASRWWDPNSEFKPLHDINPLRLNWIDQAIALHGKKVIDIDGAALCVAPDAVCALDLSSQCRELLERGFLRFCIRLIKNQSAKPVMAGAAACRINAAKTDDHRKLCHDMPSRGCNGNAYYIGQTTVYIMAK